MFLAEGQKRNHGDSLRILIKVPEGVAVVWVRAVAVPMVTCAHSFQLFLRWNYYNIDGTIII